MQILSSEISIIEDPHNIITFCDFCQVQTQSIMCVIRP